MNRIIKADLFRYGGLSGTRGFYKRSFNSRIQIYVFIAENFAMQKTLFEVVVL